MSNANERVGFFCGLTLMSLGIPCHRPLEMVVDGKLGDTKVSLSDGTLVCSEHGTVSREHALPRTTLFTSILKEEFERLPRPSKEAVNNAIKLGFRPDDVGECSSSTDPTQERKGDAVVLVQEPFVPDPRVAQETLKRVQEYRPATVSPPADPTNEISYPHVVNMFMCACAQTGNEKRQYRLVRISPPDADEYRSLVLERHGDNDAMGYVSWVRVDEEEGYVVMSHMYEELHNAQLMGEKKQYIEGIEQGGAT